MTSVWRTFIDARRELMKTKIKKGNYEASIQAPKMVYSEMKRYIPEKDAVVVIQDSSNSTAIHASISRYRENEKIGFHVQMEDIKDYDGRILLSKGTLTEFTWKKDSKDKSLEVDQIDNIIQTYLG